MIAIEEVNLKSILPSNGPSINEVKKYLEKYSEERIVIKCGGSVLINPNLFNLFISDIAIMNKLGLTPIIVHGGGKRINNKLKELNIESTFIKGLRVTNEDTIDVVEDVLIEFNNEIVNALKEKSCNAKSITTKDNNIIALICVAVFIIQPLNIILYGYMNNISIENCVNLQNNLIKNVCIANLVIETFIFILAKDTVAWYYLILVLFPFYYGICIANMLAIIISYLCKYFAEIKLRISNTRIVPM